MTAATAARPRRTTCTGPCARLCTEDGLAAAYREHRSALLGQARGMLRDQGLAEDCVQEVFARAWAACASFDPSAGPSLRAWLKTITRNVVIDLVRARAVRPQLPRSMPVVDEPAGGPSPIDSALLRLVLVDALAEVSDEHRGVVVRAVLHDRSYAEVAAELDIPVGTVKSRVFYALRGMRGRLDRADLVA